MKPYIFLIYLLTCITNFTHCKTYYLALDSTQYVNYGYLGGNTFEIKLDEGESLTETIIQVKSTSISVVDSQVFTYSYPEKKETKTAYYPLYVQLFNPSPDDLVKQNEIQVIATTTSSFFYPLSLPTNTQVKNKEKNETTPNFWLGLYATCKISNNQNQYTLSFTFPQIRAQTGASIYSGYTAFIQK